MKTRISAGMAGFASGPDLQLANPVLCIFAFLAFALSASCEAIDPSPYTFTTLTEKSDTQHFNPKSIAVDATGHIYFADAKNQVICRIEPSGAVTIIAGKSGSAGSADGAGSQARFYHPCGIAIDATGNIYVADTDNNTIRRIRPDGAVSTLAGLAGAAGSSDGTGSYARFNYPMGIAIDSLGNIYVADLFNSTIRKVTSNGSVTTIAGQAGIFGGADGPGNAALFNCPISIAVDSQQNVYVADLMNNAIRKITKAGLVTTIAGRMSYSFSNDDGMGLAARFRHPSGIVVDSAGNVYVADSGNQTIRRIAPNGAVKTLAGSSGQTGFLDGTGSAVRFWHPASIALDRLGNLYVTDLNNAAVRKGSEASSETLSFKTRQKLYPE